MTGPVNFYEAPAATTEDRECPVCGEAIELKALTCPHCQADISSLESNIRPPIPGSVRALAILFFFMAFLFCVGIAVTISTAGNRPIGVWLPMISMGPITVMLIALGVSYLKGHWWSWWFTIANSTMVSIVYPLVFAIRMIEKPLLNAESGMLLVFAAIAMLILFSFRGQAIKRFFQVKDAGLLKTVLAMIIVFIGQVLLVSGPAIAFVFIVGPERLLGR